MREKLIYLLTAIGAGLLAWNLHTILLVLGDEKRQDAIFRILYFHVPGGILSLTGFGIGLAASCTYLATKKLHWDAIAAAVTEVSLVFATINLITGSIWGRQQWGVWWAWDARLTGMLVCWLIFAGYLILRNAIEEPTQRARLSAVVSVFGTLDAWFVYKAIDWFPRLQHPGAVLSFRTENGIDRHLETPLLWNTLAFLAIGAVLVMVRMRQQEFSNEIDSLRRTANAY